MLFHIKKLEFASLRFMNKDKNKIKNYDTVLKKVI